MSKRVMIGLFAMSIVAILWTEARGGTTCRRIPQPNGTFLCSSTRIGSVINTLSTLTTPNPDRPDIDVDWENKFEVWGREGCANPDQLDETCGLKGNLVCKKGKHKKTTGHTISQEEDNITLPLRDTKDIKCLVMKHGECLLTATAITVDVTGCLSCTPKCVEEFGPGWTFHEFIPTAFNSVSASCSEEYDFDSFPSCNGQEIFLPEKQVLVGGTYQTTQQPDTIYRTDCVDGFCQPDEYYCELC